MEYYNIEERNLPSEIPFIDPDNMGIHIMWMYHNGYREKAIEEMIVLLKNYVKKLINSYTVNYSVTPADLEDLEQEAFYEIMYRMDSYDPFKGKPTTFFEPYIKSAVFAFLGVQFDHMSTYYSKIAAKIRKAINECNQNNLSYNENKIAAMTGYSIKTITTTMNQMKYSVSKSLDELDLSDETYLLTPEKICIRNEESKVMAESLECLDQMEKSILLIKVYSVNENGKSYTYKQIAEKTGYPIDVVKKTLNRAKLKVARAQGVKETFASHYFDNKHGIQKKKVNIIPEEEAELVALHIIESLEILENMEESLNNKESESFA